MFSPMARKMDPPRNWEKTMIDVALETLLKGKTACTAIRGCGNQSGYAEQAWNLKPFGE